MISVGYRYTREGSSIFVCVVSWSIDKHGVWGLPFTGLLSLAASYKSSLVGLVPQKTHFSIYISFYLLMAYGPRTTQGKNTKTPEEGLLLKHDIFKVSECVLFIDSVLFCSYTPHPLEYIAHYLKAQSSAKPKSLP